MACITRGALYLPPVANGREPLPLGVEFLTTIAPKSVGDWPWQPVWLFGAMWLTVGVIGLVDVIMGRLANVLFLLMVGLMVFWAVGFLGAALFGSAGYGAAAQAAFYGAIAGWTEISRRIAPALPPTPSSIERRLRVETRHDPDGTHILTYWLHRGQWVRIFPDRTET